MIKRHTKSIAVRKIKSTRVRRNNAEVLPYCWDNKMVLKKTVTVTNKKRFIKKELRIKKAIGLR